MHHSNAIMIISSSTYIDRTRLDDPLTALPWDDIDSIYTALLGDTIRIASQLPDMDLLVYRSEKEISDDYFLPYYQRIQLFDLTDAPLIEQIQQAVENAFANNYQRLVILFENNPLICTSVLEKIFAQLEYDDDCLVIGPTYEGKCFVVGMKSNHSKAFNASEGDPLKDHQILLKQLCNTQTIFFLLNPIHSLESGSNLIQLKKMIELQDKSGNDFPSKTFGIFKLLEKKYRFQKILS